MKRPGPDSDNDDDKAWLALLKGIYEVAETFPDDTVFIGGIAVYLHSVASGLTPTLLERSHDADLYISLLAYDDLRSIETVTSNPRLRKKQFIKYGMDYDVYLEHNNNLLVSYADIVAGSSVIDRVRVASLEHLLVLKLMALAGRSGTPKGPKDERDVIRIVLLLKRQGVVRARLERYFTADMARTLDQLSHSQEFVTLARGNLHEARTLRDAYTAMLAKRTLTMKSSRRRP
jgi:hypothetical protein